MCFLEPGDPTPDACVLATTRVGEEESAVDLLLLSRLNVYIHMIEEQLRNPALEYFPASGAVYARASIQVRANQIKRAIHKTLQNGKILSWPFVFYCTNSKFIQLGYH